MLLTWSAMLISSYTAYSVSSDSQTVQSTQAVMLPAQSVPLINHHYWPDSMTISSWLGWPDTATDQTALSARHSLFELGNPVFAVDFPFPASHFGPDSDTSYGIKLSFGNSLLVSSHKSILLGLSIFF